MFSDLCKINSNLAGPAASTKREDKNNWKNINKLFYNLDSNFLILISNTWSKTINSAANRIVKGCKGWASYGIRQMLRSFHQRKSMKFNSEIQLKRNKVLQQTQIF